MKRFRFSLERVLEYRSGLLDIEQAKLIQSIEARSRIEVEMERLIRQRADAGEAVRQARSIDAADLQALGAYTKQIAARLVRFSEQLLEVGRKVDEQRERVLHARRDLHLVEKLKQKRLADWTRAFDRELQQIADESFLARRVPSE